MLGVAHLVCSFFFFLSLVAGLLPQNMMSQLGGMGGLANLMKTMQKASGDELYTGRSTFVGKLVVC